MKATKKKETQNTTKDKYTKKQIVNSKMFCNNKDLLNALLKENKTYTKEEINEIVENYMKGKVN